MLWRGANPARVREAAHIRQPPNVANAVAGTGHGGGKAMSATSRYILRPRLQNLCGVVAPRSVGSTPAPLRYRDCQHSCGFQTSAVRGVDGH